MKRILINFLFLAIGAFIAAFAIECFLVPNSIIDGGIIGISMMSAYKTKLPLGIFIVILNIRDYYLFCNA